MVDPYDIIQMPWITEKTLEARRVADPEGNYRENNNRIEFIVRREATKADITGKHASVRLADGYDAEDAALKLGAF